MASVAKNQEDVTMPETPTVCTSPTDCGDVLDSDEDVSEHEGDGVAKEEFASALSIRYSSVQRVITEKLQLSTPSCAAKRIAN